MLYLLNYPYYKPYIQKIQLRKKANPMVSNQFEESKKYLEADTNRRLQLTLPQARIDIVTPPNLTSIRLGLINSDFPTGPLEPDTMRAVIKNPAYWAFCWGSGLAAASHVLENPKLVKGKTVCDLGCGSGVVAIAAKKAGAKKVWACDIDEDALAATKLNSHLNNVELELIQNLEDLPENVNLMFLADVLYDKNNYPLIDRGLEHAEELLITDSRIGALADQRFKIFKKMNMLTYPNLGEFEEYKDVTFFISGT